MIENLEEYLLCAFLFCKELNIINVQYIQILIKIHALVIIPLTCGINKLGNELLSTYKHHYFLLVLLLD